MRTVASGVSKCSRLSSLRLHPQKSGLLRLTSVAADSASSPILSTSFALTSGLPFNRVSRLHLARFASPPPSLLVSRTTLHESFCRVAPSYLQARDMSFFSRLRSALPSAPLGDGSEPRPTPAAASTGSPDAHLDARLGALIATQGVSKEGDLEEALAIMKELLDKEDKSASARTIVDNWERLGGWDPAKSIIHSNEAFGLYVQSLLLLNRNTDLSKAVRIRDELLTSASTSGSSNLYAPLPFPATTSTEGAQVASADANPTATGAGVAAAALPLHNAPGPVHVIVDNVTPNPATTSSKGWSAFWSAVSRGIKLFAFATIAVLVMEQAGTIKLGPTVNEFEAGGKDGGKVIKFEDVRGVDEAKDELQEVVEFLRDPERFSTLGGRLPKGILLTGPPGTGKTMLARAVAGEAGVPFFFASGSEFEEMFVGVGAKRIRELFAAAKKKSPAIIFIDELDSVGGKRSSKDQAAMKQTVNQLLTELDGFAASTGVIVIAATNFPQSLDPALVRPGRFDRHVAVPLPDVRGRVEILKHYISDIIADKDVDASTIARGTPGMSGADLQNLVNQAAVKASREGAKAVGLKDFEWAKDRIMMGAERKSHFVTPEAKRMTAYHEGGHALVALLTEGAMPLHKVTVLPRGQALGITFQLPEMDRDSFSYKEYLARIDVAMGGRVAEELIYGKENVTSGAHSDLVAASNVASAMVKEMGFSDLVGLVSHGDESVYLSERKKDEIESEIRGLIEAGALRAMNLLKTNRQSLDTLANALIRYETLSADEVRTVLRNGGILPGLEPEGDSLAGPSI